MKIFLGNPPWKKGSRLGVRAGSRWPFTLGVPEGARKPEYIPFPFFLAYAAAVLERDGFTVMLIPSRRYVVKDDRSSCYETEAYDRLRREISAKGIRIIDMREVFAAETDRKSLYWKGDGHWSYRGMKIAAERLHRAVEKPATVTTPAAP